MQSVKNLKQMFGILLGLFGISALFSSCNKETTCDCTYTVTYQGQSFTSNFEATVEGKCETLELTYQGGGSGTFECEE